MSPRPVPSPPQPLRWDSEFLGFPVARLPARHLSAAELVTLLDQQRAAGTRLLYLVADPADVETAAAIRHAGARLLDRKVTFAQELSRPPAGPAGRPEDSSGRPAALHVAATTVFTPQLEALAWQSGKFSRFQLDEQFAPNVFPDLYSRWLRASLTGELARVVLAAGLPAGGKVGLLTLGQEDDTATIGLLAVDAAARGRGVGRQLLAAAQQRARAWGCRQLQVSTQRANAPACGFYAACGFTAVREEHVYHLWL